MGACRAGTATCAPDGSAYGPCVDEILPKSEDCSTSDDDDCNGSTTCDKVVWAKSFGGPEEQGVMDVVMAPDGSIFVGGFFSGTISFGGETFSDHFNNDAYITKLSPSGDPIWSRAIGSTNYEIVYDLALDNLGQLYAVGEFFKEIDLGGVVLSSELNNVFLARFDTNGNLLGAKAFGDIGSFSSPYIAITKENDVVLLTGGKGTVDFGGGPLTSAGSDDVFLAKFDSSGQHLWSKRFGDAEFQSGTRVAVDPADNIVIAGWYSGSIDFGGGVFANSSASDRNMFIAKFDPAGNHLLSKSLGDAGNQNIMDIGIDSTGNIVVTGTYDYDFDAGGGPIASTWSNDVFLAKFDAEGNHVFSRGFGDSAVQHTGRLAIDATGRIALTFQYNAGGNGFSLDGTNHIQSIDGTDSLVAIFSDEGTYQWTVPISGALQQYADPVTFDVNGDIIVGGMYEATVDFGGSESLMSVASSDMYLVKLAAGKAP